MAATTREDRHDGDVVADDAIARGFRAAVGEAVRFLGATAPNPPVGCAILDASGRILSLAAHPRAGEPHAEALALQQCRASGRLQHATTAIVTLEPCNHVGRTGRCTEAILSSPIRTVWIGVPDPNPHVAGGGASALAEAGLQIRAPRAGSVAALDCAALIAPFATATRTGRPWVTVKQALDARSGMIPPPGAKTFTGTDALRLAHRLRRATDAIVTGMGTILADRPHLTVRHVPDHPERRRQLAVLDRGGGLPQAYRLEAEARGFLVRTAPELEALLRLLAAEGALWAMVEAGPRLLALDRAGRAVGRLADDTAAGRAKLGAAGRRGPSVGAGAGRRDAAAADRGDPVPCAGVAGLR